MQSCWLVQEDKSSCILFLSGWGMDPAPFRSIPAGDHDLLMVYDYRQVEPAAIMELTGKYDVLHLVAWSMGVWIAGKFFSAYKDRFASATAVNGTLMPIDDQCGIPPKAFNGMINEFSTTVLEGFYRDMFDQQDQVERFLNSRPDRSAGSVLDELQTLQQMYSELGPGDDIFDRKIVGSRDRIFPARSQLRCWGGGNCERIKAAHFPFYDWSSWDLITGGGSQASCD
jgi:biotin synthesis protein BioG